MPLHAAVCLTGLERSFVEVGLNVREGLFTMLRGAVVSVFGAGAVGYGARVRPVQVRDAPPIPLVVP